VRKFSFNLQRVLEYRETIEEKLLIELAAIRSDHDRALAELGLITAARDDFRHAMKERLSEGDADEIKQAYRYLNELTRRVKSQHFTVNELRQQKDDKTAEVLEAAKERKVLERLKEHKHLEHTRESGRQDQKFLDDIASIGHGRRKVVRASSGRGRK
jgi:flagellar FliJ protein